jgi:hypothetical protein
VHECKIYQLWKVKKSRRTLTILIRCSSLLDLKLCHDACQEQPRGEPEEEKEEAASVEQQPHAAPPHAAPLQEQILQTRVQRSHCFEFVRCRCKDLIA